MLKVQDGGLGKGVGTRSFRTKRDGDDGAATICDGTVCAEDDEDEEELKSSNLAELDVEQPQSDDSEDIELF